MLLALALGSASALQAQTLVDSRFAVETVVTLPPYTPVGVTWTPDGRMLVWQKSGVVRVVKNGTLLPTPFLDISSHVNNNHDHGMLGLALDPAFETNGYVYLLYVYEDNPGAPTAPKTGRLTRVQADPSNPDVALAGETVILGSISTPPCSNYPAGSDCIAFDSDSHSVGSLRFGGDGTLFASLGDGAGYNTADPLALRAQDLNSYNGKILRINPDGSAPPDNPFYDGTGSIRSKVYSYGLRNPYRFSLEPTSGEPVIGDVGWGNYEEIDFGRAKNFGWPCYEGPTALSDYAALSTTCANMPASAVTFGAYTYDHSVGQTAIGGLVYDGTTFPSQYQGQYFFADYSANWMRYGQLDASGVLQNVQTFATGLSGPVDLELGPDGALYVVEFVSGLVQRVRFTLATAPVVSASVTPSSGYSPLGVQFSSAGSASPDGSALSYQWSFGDGTTSTLANPTHTYTSATVATFNASLTVTTANGGTATAPVRVVVGSLPPSATITSPASGITVHPGDTVNFSATASDPDETLTAAAYSWQILLHHDNHVHAEGTASGPSGSFVVQDHGTGTYYYELVLTVTDSSGLSVTKSVRTAIVTVLTAVRINAGGPAYTDTLGQVWAADTDFNTGNAASTTDVISDPNAPLYQTERWDPSAAPELVYSIPVANGTYDVNLHFAEIYSGAAYVGGRVFNVSIQGTQVLQNFDIFAAVGFEKPLVKSFTASVANGVLTISFGHVVENPKISAIEVVPSPSTSPPPPPPPSSGPIRVNAGGPAFTDASGNSWDADRNFNTGNAATSATTWTGANPQLYSTERWDPSTAPEMSYSFAVASGTYTVNLHFAEIYFQSAGARQFGVNIDGARVLDNFDIYAQAGFMQPLVKSFVVNVTGTTLTIDFVHEIENPKISGIEIIAGGTTPPPPPPPTRTTYGNGGNPWAVSATAATRIQAENYDTGGEGVAYHDVDATNNGGQYRPGDGVDMEAASGGGYDVGWIIAGEWLEYTVNVAAAGTYDLKLHVARQPTGTSTVDVLFGGADVTGNITVPSTGGWQTWTDVVRTAVRLAAGQQVMRIAMVGGDFNVDWIEISPSTTTTTQTLTVTTSGTGTGTVTSSPAGISCPGQCSAAYASGTSVALTATPAAGSTFTGWGGACTGTGACTVTMSSSVAVSAAFAPSTSTSYTLTVATSGTGSGSVTSSPAGITCPGQCSAAFASGTSVGLTATPAAGSTFAGWGGACTGTGACMVTMNAAASVSATFNATAPPPASLTIYGDALATDWSDWSWSATVNLQAASPVEGGTRAANVTYTAGWAGFSLRKGTALSTAGYTTLDFWVNGGSSSKALRIYVQTSDSGSAGPAVTVTAPANTWTEIKVPLSALGSPTSIKRLNFQNNSASSQTLMTYDEIRLVP